MWMVARIYFYDEQKHHLLLFCIRPLLTALYQQALIDQAYFLRRWQRGPHICLYCHTKTAHLPALESTITTSVSSYFASHPSTRILREEEVRVTYERLAVLEEITGPVLPLQPDNSICFEADDVLAEHYGGSKILDLVRLFLSQSTLLIFELLERTQENKSALLSQMFSWMLITASCLGDIHHTYITYRSHIEGYLYHFDRDHSLRHHFKKQYEKQAAILRSRLQPYLLLPHPPGNDLDERLRELFLNVRLQLQQAINEDNVRLPPRGRAPSPFHQAARNLPGMENYLHSAEFTLRRILVNLLYELMLQSGIRPIEKCFLCYVVASSVEEAIGASEVSA